MGASVLLILKEDGVVRQVKAAAESLLGLQRVLFRLRQELFIHLLLRSLQQASEDCFNISL